MHVSRDVCTDVSRDVRMDVSRVKDLCLLAVFIGGTLRDLLCAVGAVVGRSLEGAMDLAYGPMTQNITAIQTMPKLL